MALATTDMTGYARALTPRTFRFPEDHGPHPEFLIEWWHFVGNVDTTAGRRFGYQLTFFRRALAPPGSPNSPRHVFVAHLALTDMEEGSFFAFDRVGGDEGGRAGARPAPLRIWLGNWSAEIGQDSCWRLRASERGIGVDFRLRPVKPPVFHGEEGLSRKGPEPGNASYYYSLSRLLTKGSLTVGGEHHEVTGLSWLDREWSTSPLAYGQRGWDWFALQLDDGRELVYGQIRRDDGQAMSYGAASLIDAAGRKLSLAHEDVAVEALDRWPSPTDRAEYPTSWHLRVPSHGIDLHIRPAIADQEVSLTGMRYWEGAVDVTGTSQGRGYVELTGYAEPESSSS
jgi:predicted secreted hydrolase